MLDQQRFRNQDLVLKVSTNVNPRIFDISVYEPFIDALCGTREYQKEAIRTTLRYFLGGNYLNLRQLAEKNYDENPIIRSKYPTFRDMERHLQLPDQLSCSIDLATGTGKSYVMYGIARIMLAHGVVDRVLVICPSNTIEKGLTKKFKQLSSDSNLRDLLPEESRILTPHIINANDSITDGTICIENYHATLERVKSSIRDSLRGKGERTLILNDEVHHVYNLKDAELKRWKEFLLSPEFSFKFIAGFSGTCYVGDDYFTDVISRYSLREAIEAVYVKTIDYVAEDNSDSQDEKFQKIYDNHIQNKFLYRKVKPLTLIVTADIPSCKKLTNDFINFLSDQEGISFDDAAKKVIAVTSSKEHLKNLLDLESVDDSNNPVEWIISVSMLSEGWDVQNVFQIVPHEKRAFNSKLLISQVLGRGLRVPELYRGERIVVTVFNHDNWSTSIKHLVDEVLEIEKRIYSFPVNKTEDYNFTLLQIDYKKIQEIEEFEQTDEYEFNKGYVTLVSQVPSLERETIYTRVNTGEQRQKKTLVRYKMFTVDEVVSHIHSKLKAIDTEEGTNYSEKYTTEWLRNLVRESLRRVGETEDRVSEENRQKLQSAFNVIHRKYSKVPRFRMTPNSIYEIHTAKRRKDSVSLGSLRQGNITIFLDDYSLQLSNEEERAILQEILDDESLPRAAVHKVENTYFFKTPQNVVIADHKNERDFIRQLIKSENAKVIDAWVKSPDTDFYSIDFSWKKGASQKRGSFNPDFFVKKGNHIFVLEIKDDDEINEPSDENKGKYKYATQHFAKLNSQQNEQVYHFHFLTPKDFDKFFKFVRDDNYDFVSQLEVALEEN